jgi:hypothetical protein
MCYSKAVNVRLWELEEYQDHHADLLPLIDPRWINSQLTRTMVSIGPSRMKVWATVDLAKVHHYLSYTNDQPSDFNIQ